MYYSSSEDLSKWLTKAQLSVSILLIPSTNLSPILYLNNATLVGKNVKFRQIETK